MSKEGKSNAELLKRCNKWYNRIGLIYIMGCGMYILVATFLMLITVAGDVMFLFLDGLVFKGLLFFFGYGAVYKRNDYMAIIASCIAVINTILPELTGGMNYMDKFLVAAGAGRVEMADFVAVLTIILSVITLKINKDYRYLEQQEGFPHFNEIEKELLNAPKEYVPEYASMKEKFHIEARDGMEDIPEPLNDSMEDILEIPKDSK